MTQRRGIAAAAMVAAMLFLLAVRAEAHALLRASNPVDGARLPSGPQDVTLTFTEPPERSLSVVRVLDAVGVQYGMGQPVVSKSDNHVLAQKVRTLGDGVYTVAWRVVSRVDGHVTSGAFAFGVGQTTTPIEVSNAPKSTTPPVSPWEVLGRWVMFLGFAGLLGGAFVVGSLDGAIGRRFAWTSWSIALAGAIGLALAQRAATGASLGTFLGTSLGRITVTRTLGVVLAGIGVALGRRAGPVIAGGFTALAVLAHVAGGHAAAASVPATAIAGQWVHVVAAVSWIGGLAALLVAVRSAPDRASIVKRFSTVAAYLVAVVAITGVVRALGEVDRWSELTSTGYGRGVVAKSVLLLGLAAFGALNRYRSVPAAAQSTDTLQRISRGEMALATLTFAVAGLLASTSPPQTAAATSSQPSVLTASGSDFATSVRVELEARPGRPGPNAFSVRALDYDTRRPVQADVSLRFTFLDDPAVGTSQLRLTRSPNGTYTGNGANLSLQGRWRIVVRIERGVDTVEVPLEVSVRVAPPKVRVDRIPGQPTLYTVEFAEGGSVQVYADPERAGRTDLHVTFFDAKGNERQIRSITVTLRPPSGASATNTPRRFSPGHFVAEVTMAAGTTRVVVDAETTTGERVTTELEVAIP